MSTRIFISAGEASGEYYGGLLLDALRKKSEVEFFGLGGDRMRAAGCEIVTDSRRVAVVGLVEVIKHLPGIYREFHKLLEAVDKQPPQAAVLVDFPDFNLRLAKELHKRSIPVVYFVSPQLWAWRKGRIHQVKRYVKKMLVIFPFEEEFYRENGVDAEYVGHPLADLPALVGTSSDSRSVALLPGSRRQEVERNLPEMLRAAHLLGSDYKYLLPVASTLDKSWVQQKISELNSALPIELTYDARATLASSRAAIVASGTATVEAALVGNPFVVVYRVAPTTWKLGRRLVNLESFAMVNLIAGKKVVPELIQEDFTAEKVVKALRNLLPDGVERSQIMEGLAEVRKKLHPSSDSVTAAERAADAILKVVEQRN